MSSMPAFHPEDHDPEDVLSVELTKAEVMYIAMTLPPTGLATVIIAKMARCIEEQKEGR